MKELNEALRLEEQYLYEMAIINPRMCRNLTIQVELEQRDEGPIPHVHVYHDKTRNRRKCTCVRLDKAEYTEHHSSGEPLPRKLKEQFISLMTSPSNEYSKNNKGKIVQLNGHQLAVKIWMDTYGDNYSMFDFDEDGIPITPDYSKLPSGK